MKLNSQSISRIIAGLLVPATLALSTAQAAEVVHWADLPKKIGSAKPHRAYVVTTKSGSTQSGREITFGDDKMWVSPSGPPVARDDVAEIRVQRNRALSDAVFAPGGAVVKGAFDAWSWLILPALPVAWGVVVAAVPITLPLEGIKRLLPDKVFTVAP